MRRPQDPFRYSNDTGPTEFSFGPGLVPPGQGARDAQTRRHVPRHYPETWSGRAHAIPHPATPACRSRRRAADRRDRPNPRADDGSRAETVQGCGAAVPENSAGARR